MLRGICFVCNQGLRPHPPLASRKARHGSAATGQGPMSLTHHTDDVPQDAGMVQHTPRHYHLLHRHTQCDAVPVTVTVFTQPTNNFKVESLLVVCSEQARVRHRCMCAQMRAHATCVRACANVHARVLMCVCVHMRMRALACVYICVLLCCLAAPPPTCTASRSVMPSPIMTMVLYGLRCLMPAMAVGLPRLCAVGSLMSNPTKRVGSPAAACLRCEHCFQEAKPKRVPEHIGAKSLREVVQVLQKN